jgi:hypothetical protein
MIKRTVVGRVIYCNSAAETRREIERLVARGYDIFRGQLFPWPLVAPLFRAPSEKRDALASEVLDFVDWCRKQPAITK